MRWTEQLFDTKNEEEAHSMVSANSQGIYKLVIVEMNHRQLGYTDDWLRAKLEEALADGASGKRDFLNIWESGSSSSVLTKDIIERVKNSEREPDHTTIMGDKYIINWYISEKEREAYRSRPLVGSLDTSDAIGNDDIFLVIKDPSTGATLGAGKYNETNTIMFSKFLFEVIRTYRKLVLDIERRSTATTMIDNIILLCQEAECDPFKHLFNWVVNDSDEKPSRFAEIDMPLHKRDPDVYVKYRKLFGFATSGSGRTSRSSLYGETFNHALKYTVDVIYDKVIGHQLRSLVKKNGRIDHTASDGDDSVIAWLLGHWFLTKATNVSFYGHEVNDYLSAVSLNNPVIANAVTSDKKRKRL
jgi:hypothetical protein